MDVSGMATRRQHPHDTTKIYHHQPRHATSLPLPTRSQEEIDTILAAVCRDTGYKSEQQHGLRRLVRPTGDAQSGQEMVPQQQRGCEIFVGRLPKDLLEDELLRLCGPFGEVLEVRLMLQPECVLLNRGFAFVVFGKREDAKTAIEKLDRVEIRPGQRIGVKKSVDNCRLFMGGLPRDKTKEEFEVEIRKLPACAGTMRKVIMYPAVQDRTKNRGFAFVEFSSHREAAIARRQLMREKLQLWGKEICVDWAQPEGEVEQDVMNQVRILYVRNLNMETTEDTLREEFSAALPEGRLIEKVKKLKDFGFIHFQDREDAERALNALNGRIVDGSQIEVMWAKPASAKIRQQQQQQETQRRSHQETYWTRNGTCHFPPHLQLPHPGLEYGPVHLQHAWRPINGIRNLISQRYFRNAAGTRTRFSRPNGSQYPNVYQVQIGPNGYPENFQYGHQDQFNPYHPGAFYNQPVMYHHPSSTPPMPYHGSPTFQYAQPGLLPYQNHNLSEQFSHLTLHGQPHDVKGGENGSMPDSGSDNGFPPLSSPYEH